MKSLSKVIVPCIIALALLTQCDSVTSNDPSNEQPPKEAPTNSTSKLTLLSPEDNADKVSTNLEFTWKKLTGASSYEYQLSDNSSFSPGIIDTTVSDTTFKPGKLGYQKDYYWRVKAAVANSEWSDVWNFTTGIADDDETVPAVVPISPSDLASDVTVDPAFKWKELPGIEEYDYELSDNSSFSSSIINTTVSDTSFKPGELDYQRDYYWRVKAAVANSEWSDVWSFTTEPEPNTPPPVSDSFVQVQNSNFVKDGNVFHFAATNAYYLPNYEKLNSGVVDRALDLFEATGINVVRMWGFYDGYDCGYSKNDPNENVIQTAPGVYDEEALKDLDQVIAKGKERGILFIMPFINFWDQLGGVCQYNTWAGASDPSTNMEFFLNNEQTQKWFKDYISMLLNRVNTVTGVAYKNEPAILGWQIMNEGRNSGKDATILRNWYQEIARYIKSIDSNHLLSTGEEGFDEDTPSQYSVDDYSNTYTLRAQEGTSYIMNTAIPEIDFGNAHWYPTEYGFGSTVDEEFLRAQRAWLNDHKKIAESSGKPFIIGEFGYPGWGDERVSAMYNPLYEHAESIQLDGGLLWQLTADYTKCWEFGGNICYPEGRVDTQLYNEFKQHVSNMNNLH